MADDDDARGATATAADADRADDARADPDPEAPPARRRALDGRTLALCALVALIAAVLAGLVTARLTDDDEPESGQGSLTAAVSVPDIGLRTLDGEGEVSLAAYAGQPVVVNFWGSWCVPCVEEMPDLQRVHESLGDTVAFVGVNVNDDEEAARAMAERTGVTYDLVRDTDGELIRALDVTTFPTTVLVDADGTVVDTVRRQVSSERLCEKINQSLLNQQLEECG